MPNEAQTNAANCFLLRAVTTGRAKKLPILQANQLEVIGLFFLESSGGFGGVLLFQNEGFERICPPGAVLYCTVKRGVSLISSRRLKNAFVAAVFRAKNMKPYKI